MVFYRFRTFIRDSFNKYLTGLLTNRWPTIFGAEIDGDLRFFWRDIQDYLETFVFNYYREHEDSLSRYKGSLAAEVFEMYNEKNENYSDLYSSQNVSVIFLLYFTECIKELLIICVQLHGYLIYWIRWK